MTSFATDYRDYRQKRKIQSAIKDSQFDDEIDFTIIYGADHSNANEKTNFPFEERKINCKYHLETFSSQLLIFQ